MTRRLMLTKDGSHTIQLEPDGETFHSHHGAVQESAHVYIQEGWKQLPDSNVQPVRILEMGLGTGLNVLLTLIESLVSGRSVRYEALELYPLEESLYRELNYCTCLNQPSLQEAFMKLHDAAWETPTTLAPGFELLKHHISLTGFQPHHRYHLIYFDAFAPGSDEALWTAEQFSKLYQALEPGGLLVTYCSKVPVRRALEAAGFQVKKVQGPWGKREIVRAIKANSQ